MKPSISTLTALTVALFVGLLAAAPAFGQQAPQPAAASTAAPGNPAALDKAPAQSSCKALRPLRRLTPGR